MSKRKVEAIGDRDESSSKHTTPLVLPAELEERMKAEGFLSKKYFVMKYLDLAYFGKLEPGSELMKKVQTKLREWIDSSSLCLRICDYYNSVAGKTKQFGGTREFHSIRYFRGEIVVGYVTIPATHKELVAQVQLILPVKGEYVESSEDSSTEQRLASGYTATTVEFDIIRGIFAGTGGVPSIFEEEFPSDERLEETHRLQIRAIKQVYVEA